MADYGRNFTDELRDRLSIYDVVSRRVPLNKKGNNYWGCCPFHNEKTPSFSVNPEKGFYHCFGCGEHGDIISFTMKTGNMDFKAAISELADMAGIRVPTYKPKTEQQIKLEESYFDITNAAAELFIKKLYEPEGVDALEYIKGRGFTDDDIKKYQIGFAPKNNIISNLFINKFKQKNIENTGLIRNGDYGPYDFFRNKLMFSIKNERGNIVAFSGRSMDGTEPKYIYTSDTEFFHKRQTVFGLSDAKEFIYKNNRTIIVEGQIDAIKMQLSGFGETVAPLGTALTEEHIAKICKINRNIIFCFDGDNAGRKAAARGADIIMPFVKNNSEIKFAFMPDKQDPDDILKLPNGKKLMKDILDNAKPLVDFLWDSVNQIYIVSTPNGRNQAEKHLQKQVDKITDQSLKSEWAREYNSRKFNEWHRWKKDNKNTVNISMESADKITMNNLKIIIEHYPEIAEQEIEFIQTFEISNSSSVENNLDKISAEKFIKKLKLDSELKKLKLKLADLISRMLNGEENLKDEKLKTENKINQINLELSNMDNE